MMQTHPTVGFDSDVKPLFRESDRAAMSKVFDLWSYDDVVRWEDAILAHLADGSMPCDGQWSAARIDLFKRWIADGSQP
jgi:hypothetical protein